MMKYLLTAVLIAAAMTLRAQDRTTSVPTAPPSVRPMKASPAEVAPSITDLEKAPKAETHRRPVPAAAASNGAASAAPAPRAYARPAAPARPASVKDAKPEGAAPAPPARPAPPANLPAKVKSETPQS